MKHCPRCKHTGAWTLGDGRFKCQGCGTRFSWTSVWDSVRLSPESKDRLIESFARGISVYQQRAEGDASPCSKERFYRLARACCAFAEHLHEPISQMVESRPDALSGRSSMRGWAAADRVILIGFQIDATGKLRIPGASSWNASEVVRLLRECAPLGGVFTLPSGRAFASLKLQGGYVVMQRSGSVTMAADFLESFWNYAKQHLQLYRKIPSKFFHLYMGEVCFRFNHRQQDLAVLLRDLLSAVSINEIKPILQGPESLGDRAFFPTNLGQNIGSQM